MRHHSNFTFTAVIKACADVSALGYGRVIHAHVFSSGLGQDFYIQAALITFYAKSGHLGVARMVFDQMSGYGKEAIELFHQMRTCGPRPNDVTFIAYIEESFHGKPPAAVCTAMLGACKMHKKYELGVQVAEHLLTIEPDNPGHYVLLSDMYALAGRMDRVEVIRKLMRRKGLKKQVGYTVIEVDNVSHMFCLGDTSHPHTAEIYKYLENLMWKCKQAGYIPETDSMMHDLEEEEREFALRFHSEKLAIAFGLMKTSQGSTIRIIKNL
ncbi:hypothetical protein IFM89_025746 [Coptis chinensis]|uniref:DYW domain-containing protein n=1 Tax=Coptis chinensis TaxID=261450 RepID=A0A835I471_9MAGN|nr:hypothetical protein IFM89_025746 [Coptis chinensis]